MNVVQRCVRPTSAFQPPTDLYPCSRFSILLAFDGGDRREGHFHDVRIPALAGRAATRAVLGRLIVSRPFTTSPRTPRHPRMHAIGLARIEIVSSVPREKARLDAIRDVFLRGTLERHTSFYGGSPSGFPKEPSLNGCRSHGLCHPGPTRRRPLRERCVSPSS
jgi:hypothetical protein